MMKIHCYLNMRPTYLERARNIKYPTGNRPHGKARCTSLKVISSGCNAPKVVKPPLQLNAVCNIAFIIYYVDVINFTSYLRQRLNTMYL